MGNNSPPNIIPLLTGHIEVIERRDYREDFFGNETVYAKTWNMGFVTMLGTEFCHRYYS
jgi:hypothetical protein